MFSPIIWLGFSKWWKNKNNVSDIVKKHVTNNAKEFFCWYNPPYWHEKFGFEVSPNGRFAEHEQINDFDSLKEIVQEVHKHWIKIMWNINHRYYTQVCAKEFKMMIDDFLEVWIDWFIVSSMWTLEYLEEISEWKRERWYIIRWSKIQLNISTIMAVYNIHAIEFLLENYPIYKVILSREVTIPEIEKIVETFPNLIFEVFGEWDFCRYNNWLCFAEHKYTDRDICTLVVNDLIVKQSINYDYRKIIQNKDLTNNQKSKFFENDYYDDFQVLNELYEEYELNNKGLEKCADQLSKIVRSKIVFYDPLQGKATEQNRNFHLVYLITKTLIENEIDLNLNYFDSLENFRDYLQTEYKLWRKQYLENLKTMLGWHFWVQAKYKDDFYNRADNLNLYSYVFFDKFENIDTVKFPTRWRDYLPKIQLIDSCVESPDKVFEELDMNISFERANYNLKYLFKNNKYWFYDLRKQIHDRYV